MNNEKEPDWRARLGQAMADRERKPQELSLAAGLNIHYVSRLLKGGNSTIEKLSKVCDELGIRMAYLFSDGSNVEITEDVLKMVQGLSEEEGQKVLRILESSRGKQVDGKP